MVAEAVWSFEFRDAFNKLEPGKKIEVDFAIYEIEEDPSWGLPNRAMAAAYSPYSGFLADLSVDGYAIIYKIVDSGAAIELWYLHELPGWEALRPPPEPTVPMM